MAQTEALDIVMQQLLHHNVQRRRLCHLFLVAPFFPGGRGLVALPHVHGRERDAVGLPTLGTPVALAFVRLRPPMHLGVVTVS